MLISQLKFQPFHQEMQSVLKYNMGNTVIIRALCMVNGSRVNSSLHNQGCMAKTTKIIKAIATVRSCRDWHGSGLPPRIDADK